MSIILAIVIGLIALLAGVGMAYSLLEHRLNVQEQRHRTRARRDIEEVERSYTERMQQRIDALKSQYDTQIQQLTNQLEATPQIETVKAQYEAQIQDLTQQLAAAQATPTATPATETNIALAIEPEPSPSLEPDLALEATEPTDLAELMELTEPTDLAELMELTEPTALAEAPEPTESTLTPAPLQTKTIAPRSSGITLEDLTTLPYISQDTSRIELAEGLLEALQGQSCLEISPTFLFQTLKRLSQDPLPRLRELAVLCLAQTHSSRSIPLLRPRLWDTDLTVVQAANQALEFWRPHGKLKPQKGKSKPRKPSRKS
ncbi:MAG: HEAT repeat domain-containing protein [Prochlorotrichaceae cyanobacterium]|jgi:hypothetical protein